MTHKKTKPASIRTVSDALGMNVSTVSRILNRKAGFSYAEETIERVHRKAQELGYRPNRLVQGVIQGKSMTIGVVIRLTAYYDQVVIGIHNALADQGYLPVLGASKTLISDAPGSTEQEILDTLLDHRVDGIIFRPVNEDISGDFFQEAYDRGIPLVAVDRELPRLEVDLVTSDDASGGLLAAKHLLELGHRHIAIPSISPGVSSYVKRLNSFTDCVKNAGGDVQSVDFSSVDALAALMSSNNAPTACFAHTDSLLRYIYRAASTLNVRIPEDLSVMGFGNQSDSRILTPESTTIEQHPQAVGSRAAKLVLARIADPDRPIECIRVPVHLVERHSTGKRNSS